MISGVRECQSASATMMRRDAALRLVASYIVSATDCKTTTCCPTPGAIAPDIDRLHATLHLQLDRMIRDQPKNACAHYWQARLYALRHEVRFGERRRRVVRFLHRAIHHARMAVELEPENVIYREALALCLFRGHRSAEAQRVMAFLGASRHPISLLLRDLEAVPVPPGGVDIDSEYLAERLLEQGLLPRDYPYLRSRLYVIPSSARSVEHYFGGNGDGAFVQKGVFESPQAKVVIKHLDRVADREESAARTDRLFNEGISVLLAEVEEAPSPSSNGRRRTPRGTRFPAGFTHRYCYLFIANFRLAG